MSEPLVISDDRYDRLRLIAWWDQEKLRRAKILVVGAGALGNEVLKNLALLGIGRVWIVDFDAIEDTNLTRSVLFRSRDRGRNKAAAAADAVRDINPDTRVTPLPCNVITGIGLGLFRDVDVVIGCLDNREARLWVNRQCWKAGTPWIDAGIQEINGVVKTFSPPDSACYECAMTENDYRLINLRYSCPLLRREDLLAGKVPTAPTIASMIGGLQVQEALKLLHGLPVATGEALVYNGIANSFYRTAFQRKDDCLSHETYGEPIELPLTSAARADELFAAVRARHSAANLRLELERDLVVSLACAGCHNVRRVMRPRQLVAHTEAQCPQCGGLAKPRQIHAVAPGDEFAREPLSALGVAPYDVVRVSNGETTESYLIAGDRHLFAEEGATS